MFRGGATENENFQPYDKENEETYTDIPSSLIMYPIPYPSAATGPKPNNLRAGLPQFEVERMDVPSVAQPESVKILGILVSLCEGGVEEVLEEVIPFGRGSRLRSCR